MNNINIHFKKLTFFAILLLCLSSIFSCSKEESNNPFPPIIELKIGGIYTSHDTAIAEGSQICIGIKAIANGGVNLCNLIVESNNSLRLLDYGFNASSIDKDVLIHKNTDSIQKISVIIRNINGKSDTVSIVLQKNGSAYKPIRSYVFTLGGQNNTAYGSFASFTNGIVYSMADASQNQALIDILYYYNPLNLEYNCLASAGGNIIGIYAGTNSPENWTIKNTTYFSRTLVDIPLSAFDNAQTDSIIIANLFTNGGRKAKALSPNQIWGFQTQTGNFGLLKIIEVNGLESGSLKFAVKMQQ